MVDWNAVAVGVGAVVLLALLVLSVVLVLRHPPAREFWVNAFVKAAAALLDAAVLALTKMLEQEAAEADLAAGAYNPTVDARLGRVQALRDGLKGEVRGG